MVPRLEVDNVYYLNKRLSFKLCKFFRMVFQLSMQSQQKFDRSDIRKMNAVSVLDQLRGKGPMSRAMIAGSLGLTRATVSNIVSDLLDASIVYETEYVEGGAGRPGLLLNLNPDCGSMIGVHIDLDHVKVVLSNIGLEELWRGQRSLVAESGPEEVLSEVVELVEEAIQINREKKLRCFGICTSWAGLVSRGNGELAFGPTSGWEHVPLKSEWEKRFDLPVYVENEAHAGALGVHHFGKRQGVRNMIYLSLGVGLGAGVFVDGVLLRGKHGFAGQVGHARFADNGIRCGCGSHGCWVTEIGAAAVKRKLAEAGVAITRHLGSGVNWVELVAEQAAAGDERVLEVIEAVGRQIGSGAARLVQTFNPSTVILGGRLGPLFKPVEAQIREAVVAETLPFMAGELECEVSGSNDDPILGCLATIFDELMQNPLEKAV